MLDATPLLRLYAKRRLSYLAAQDAAATQRTQLLTLLRKAAATKFGQDHRFSAITSVEEYQKQVPLRFYENFWNEYWKQSFPHFQGTTWPNAVPYIPVSSGTSSGTTKYIPCSYEMVRSNTKAGIDLLVHHIHNYPHSKILAGRNFMLGGSTDLLQQAAGIYSGDLSGIAVKTLPWWARARYFPPAELALIKDWEQKVDTLARESLRADIRMISGVPSWLLIFFEKLFSLLPEDKRSIAEAYPHLEMLVHGGVNFAPYLSQFKGLLEGSGAELREVYPASEGFIGMADRGSGEGLRMVLDHGIFFEFVPLDELYKPSPVRHWIGSIEKEVSYAIVLTTCAGLWSYVIGDTVRFIETRPPRLLITGRTSYYLSAFGEHLIGEEIEDAVSFAASAIGKTVRDYSVGPLYPEKGELGRHLYIVEFTEGVPTPSEQAAFTQALDQRLIMRNEDYEAHRSNNFGLRAPTLLAAPRGAFTGWMKSRGKLGGQNKVPRIILDTNLFSALRSFTETCA